MSHTSKIFEEVPIKVQNKNGFDLSHLHCGTSKCGQLVPVLCKLLPPNSDFTLGVNMNVELPPLATSFMGRIDAICEGFVIPLSMLYGGFKQFIQNQQSTDFPPSQSNVQSYGVNENGKNINKGYDIPFFSLEYVSTNNSANYLTLSTTNDNLYEFLGARSAGLTGGGDPINLSMLPGLAYHLIWNTWYRNKQITRTIFAVNPNLSSDFNYGAFNTRNVSLIWHSFYTEYEDSGIYPYSADFTTDDASDDSINGQLTFPDGVSFFSTRQRNYSRDYFTAAMPSVQQGNASKVVFSTSGANGEFTINALRAANSLQRFLECNGISADYDQMMYNRWGTHPIDADFDEPYYLGRVIVPVYQKSVYQQDSSAKSGAVNPFAQAGAIGTKGAHGAFVGEGSITEKFHNSTWSYVMCIFSLVPHAAYGYGLNRELCMIKIGDFPAPEMQSVGNEEILKSELYCTNDSPSTNTHESTFAYTSRYSRFKYMDDVISGELRPGRTLDSFVLQRRFTGAPSFSTSFVEIPQTALDSVFAVSTASMNLSCWFEIYFSFKVSMPLADYSIPTLGEIGDTHTVKSPQGGSRL